MKSVLGATLTTCGPKNIDHSDFGELFVGESLGVVDQSSIVFRCDSVGLHSTQPDCRRRFTKLLP